MILKSFNKKISDIVGIIPAMHLTDITRLLSNNHWDEILFR